MKYETAYQEALDYIYSFIDYSLTHTFRYSPENFNLARMEKLVNSLENPHKKYSIIHVAGTKGKGSVAAMCASVLQAAEYRAGFYSSPHLQDFVERIQVNGVPISHAEVVALVQEMKPHIDAIPELTTFEITTALAMLYFARQRASASVLEVGLGGRLDATNIVMPKVSVITSISYDHTYVLGNSLAQIAGEKAGIIKPGVPVVMAPQDEEARQVIATIAEERGSPLIEVGKDYLFSVQSQSLEGQTFRVWSHSEQASVEEFFGTNGKSGRQPELFALPLLGYHQVVNAATAYAALQTARRSGFEFSNENFRKGFASVVWPGRFEILRRDPPVVVDSAHNRDSALKLRQTLDEYFPGFPVTLVFGASEDKDIQGMFAELLPRVEDVIATQSIHPRAIDPHQLVELTRPYGIPARAVPRIEEAMLEALQDSHKGRLVLVTGSLFIVAGARLVWQELHQHQTGTLE
jgi:dihydrofolate synthase / folylpolyglutamate synthase